MIAVHLADGAVEVRKAPKPRRAAGFASIRLIYGGICNTDLELQRGYYGFSRMPRSRVRRRGHRSGHSGTHRQTRCGRDQPRVRQLRMVRKGPRTPLPEANGARHRELSRRISRDPDASRSQPARRSEINSRTNMLSSPSRSRPLARSSTRSPSRRRLRSLCSATANSDCSLHRYYRLTERRSTSLAATKTSWRLPQSPASRRKLSTVVRYPSLNTTMSSKQPAQQRV